VPHNGTKYHMKQSVTCGGAPLESVGAPLESCVGGTSWILRCEMLAWWKRPQCTSYL